MGSQVQSKAWGHQPIQAIAMFIEGHEQNFHDLEYLSRRAWLGGKSYLSIDLAFPSGYFITSHP
jgi:hypothetical protein